MKKKFKRQVNLENYDGDLQKSPLPKWSFHLFIESEHALLLLDVQVELHHHFQYTLHILASDQPHSCG